MPRQVQPPPPPHVQPLPQAQPGILQYERDQQLLLDNDIQHEAEVIDQLQNPGENERGALILIDPRRHENETPMAYVRRILGETIELATNEIEHAPAIDRVMFKLFIDEYVQRVNAAPLKDTQQIIDDIATLNWNEESEFIVFYLN